MTSVVNPGPSSAPPPHQDPNGTPPLSWEGDKMFNIYIYDYCYKRGYRKTARELLQEAKIDPDAQPPINARQGLLFEWWSVFWVLFSAKGGAGANEDAQAYTQHQAQQQVLKQQQTRQAQHQQLSAPIGPSGQPGAIGAPPMSRLANGATHQPPFLPNGTNGPTLTQRGQIPSGSFNMANPAPHPNGISSGPPLATGQPGAPPGQPPNFASGLMPPGARPPGAPGPPPGTAHPRGGPNVPFAHQSPQMDHSPQNPGPPPQHSQAPMGQLGPSPSMPNMQRGGMLPPGAPGQPPQASMPGFQQRPSSRSATPGQGGMMMAPSPSMAARQVPGNANSLNSEILGLPQGLLANYLQELNIPGKDVNNMTMEEKNRVATLHRQRAGNMSRAGKPQTGPGPGPVPGNATAGPSNQAMGPPGQQRGNVPQRAAKRNSTSPGEEPQTDSPPDRKRQRRSPEAPMPYGQPQPPMAQPQQSGMPGGQPMMPMGGPPTMPPGMMRGGPMGSVPGMNGMPQGMQPQGGGPMGNMPGQMMSPAMAHPSIPGSMQQQQQRGQMQQMYNHQMAQLAKGNMGSVPGAPAGSPAGGDTPFGGPGGMPGPGPGPVGGPPFNSNPRMAMNKMPPPASPGMGGPPKDSKDVKPGPPTNADGSPRNTLGRQTPNASGTAPPTPAPGHAPSPSAVLANVGAPPPPPPPGMSGPPPMPDSIFPADFVNNLAGGLDDFSYLEGSGDLNLNFERDFGQWFNPDDIGIDLPK